MSGDTIMGIPIPGAPAGDPEVLRRAAQGWQVASGELSGAMNDALSGLDQLDWQGGGATAFHEAVATLSGHAKEAATNFSDFATGLNTAAGKIDAAQTAYNWSLGAAATAIGVGLIGTFFTFGLSDAAAAAVCTTEAGAMVATVATLDLAMVGLDSVMEITLQALLRVAFRVIGQFATNLVAQEASYAVQNGGSLTWALNYGEAGVYSVGALIPGAAGWVRGTVVSVGAGAGLDATGQLLTTGKINLDSMLMAAAAAGVLHGATKGYQSLKPAPGAVVTRVNLGPGAFPPTTIVAYGVVTRAQIKTMSAALRQVMQVTHPDLVGNMSQPITVEIAGKGLNITDLPGAQHLKGLSTGTFPLDRASGVFAPTTGTLVIRADVLTSHPEVAVHELGHMIHTGGAMPWTGGFPNPAIVDGYNARYSTKGPWVSAYAATDAGEYWAEGTRVFLGHPLSTDILTTPAQIAAADPALYAELVKAYPGVVHP